jgi:tetratricopeptide (TPR) repeat protein
VLFGCFQARAQQHAAQAIAQFIPTIARQVSRLHGQPQPGKNPGVVCHQSCRDHDALDCLDYAVAISGKAGSVHDTAPGATLDQAHTPYWRDWEDLNRLALKVAQRAGDHHGRAQALGGLSCAYFWLGRPQDVLSCVEQCLEIALDLGDRTRQQQVLVCLGSLRIRLGLWGAALDCLEQSLEIARALGDRPGEATSLYHLSETHLALGRADAAVGYLEQSLAITRPTGNRWAEAKTLWQLAAALHAYGHEDQARACRRDAVAIFEQLGV